MYFIIIITCSYYNFTPRANGPLNAHIINYLQQLEASRLPEVMRKGHHLYHNYRFSPGHESGRKSAICP
jgi:hypothetical protein